MKAFTAIVAREFDEKRFVVLAALLVAFIPFLAPLLPGVSSWPAATTMTATAGFLSIGFTLGLAVILGATTFGRDLTERRLSFYFSRPISAASIWFGRIFAALALVVFAFAVLFVPATVAGGDTWRASWNVDVPFFGLLVIGGGVALMLFSHAVSTAVRSRSALVLLDFVLIFVFAGALLIAILPLISLQWPYVLQLAAVVVALILLIVLFSGWYQLANGRIDRRASHFAFSRALWSSIGAMFLTIAAFVAWVTHASPNDFQGYARATVTTGNWAILEGTTTRRVHASFAVNVRDGRSIRLGRSFPNFGTFDNALSRDGKHAIWLSPTLGWQHFELYTQSLEPLAAPMATGIMQFGRDLAFSDDASRIAVIKDDVVSVSDVARQRILASAKLPSPQVRTASYYCFFEGSDHLGMIALSGTRSEREHRIAIFGLDVPTRHLTQTGSATLHGDFVRLTMSADGSRLLAQTWMRRSESTQQMLLDARTGVSIATLPPAESWLYTRMLTDGTIVSVENLHQGNFVLRSFNRDGSPIGESPLAIAKQASVRGQLSDDLLLLVSRPDDTSREYGHGFTSYVVNRKSGAIVRKEIDLAPLSSDWWMPLGSDPRARIIGPAQFFTDRIGSIVNWNPVTGAKKVLVQR